MMIDNKKVNDTHQEGIGRKTQRKEDMTKGQGGRMSKMPEEKANWKRSGDSLTPRKA